MATAYPINEAYGLVLTDDGEVLIVSNEGQIPATDTAKVLEVLLASASEISYLQGELQRLVGIMEGFTERLSKLPPQS